MGGIVTGVWVRTAQKDVVLSIGAGDVIDYTQEDFVKTGRHWDVILETAGARTLSDLRQALTPHGTLVIVGGEGGGKWIGKAGRMVQAPVLSPFVGQKLTILAVKHNGADLDALRELIEAGKVAPVVGKNYQLNEVPQADPTECSRPRRTRGKSVVSISTA